MGARTAARGGWLTTRLAFAWIMMNLRNCAALWLVYSQLKCFLHCCQSVVYKEQNKFSNLKPVNLLRCPIELFTKFHWRNLWIPTSWMNATLISALMCTNTRILKSPCFFLFFKRTGNAWCKVLSFWSAMNPRDNSDSESDCFGIGFTTVNLEVVL